MTRLKICTECGAEHVNQGKLCDDCLIDNRRERDTLYRRYDRHGNDAL